MAISFIYFSACCSLLFSIIHLLVRNRSLANTNLSGLLFCLGVLMIQSGFLLDGTSFDAPWLMAFHLSLLMAVIPLAAVAYHLVVYPADTLPSGKLLLFLPVAAGLAADILFIASGQAGRSVALRRYFSEPGGFPAVRLLFMLAGLLVLLRLCPLLRNLLRSLTWKNPQAIPVITVLYVAASIAGAETAIAGYTVGSLYLIRLGITSIGALFIGSLLVGVRYPKLVQVAIVETRAKYGRAAPIGDGDADAVMSRLKRLMEDEKIYLDDELSLPVISRRLGTEPHRLSRILSLYMETNFNSMLNRYRVEEAKRMLVREPERKGFYPFEKDRGWGYNVFSSGKETIKRACKMDTRIGASAYDVKNSFLLDYTPYNRFPVSGMHDEIRKINDTLYIGLGYMSAGGGAVNPSLFVLKGKPKPWAGM